jgi:hypothetical protein
MRYEETMRNTIKLAQPAQPATATNLGGDQRPLAQRETLRTMGKLNPAQNARHEFREAV